MEKSQGSQHGGRLPRRGDPPSRDSLEGHLRAEAGVADRDLGALRDWHRRKRGISRSERSRPGRDPAKNRGTVRRSNGAAK